ncbi:proline-rich protein PRCC-like [Rhopilema esculentum]|uniref:proline-rich protein PRCC-like n=1 Tax=Rhopilema esculentum TaxID=499914 RepID=UPI0031E241C4|eukprot:gene6356-11791_t
MSLVAYESSGEESEGEELEEVRDARNEGPKLDSKDETKGNGPVKVLHKGVKADNTSPADVTPLSQNEGNAEKPRKGIFSFLPPPKKRSVDFTIDEEDDIPFKRSELGRVKENVDSLDHVNKDGSTSKSEIYNGTSAKLNLPKPKRVDDKQKLKIALPSLPDDDSDSDDEGAKRKPIKSSGKIGSGLLGCLPQPKLGPSSTKAPTIQLNQRKPSRLLVPYTLSKKKEEQNSKTEKQNVKDNESDSDDDGAAQSFFSFGEKESNASNILTDSYERTNSIDSKKIISQSSQKTRSTNDKESDLSNHIPRNITSAKAVSISKSQMPAVTKAVTSKSATPSAIHKPVLNKRDESVTGPYPSKSMQSSDIESNVTGPYEDSSVVGPYGGDTSGYEYGSCSSSANPYGGVGPFNPDAPSYGHVGTGANFDYGQDHGQKAYLDPQPNYHHYQGGYESTNTALQHESIDADQLRRLQGKRERRLQEADFIDIHGEEMKFDESTRLKNMTEESSYKSNLPKNDMPSSQQRKKHQITYLAFQAKEREAELRKSWAANQQTKRQTQQKYGF